MARSQNGYTANIDSLIHSVPVPGTNVRVSVRKGPTGDLLVWLLAQVHQKVEPISTLKGGVPDDWGYAKRVIRNGLSISNHASGTAVDFNALLHGLGRRNTFTASQKVAMHGLLDLLEGAVRWGEDYRFRKDGMHLEAMADEATCARILAKVTAPMPTRKPGSRDLKIGARGGDVMTVQRLIGAKVDGIYGRDTATRVRNLERAHNKTKPALRKGTQQKLLADGVVGTNTWRMLGITPAYGAER